MRQIDSHLDHAKRYFALRFVGVVFTGLGVLLLAAGCVLLGLFVHALLAPSAAQLPRADVSIQHGPVTTVSVPGVLGAAVSALWSFGCLISGLQFLAMGALIRLMIHVEENTRISAQRLEKLRLREEPVEQGIGAFFRS